MESIKNKTYLELCIFGMLSLLFCQAQGSSLRVVGGFEAPLQFGRFHASLQNLSGYHVCGGAVISDRHVVTAAHCVKGAEPEYIKIVIGTTNLDVGGKQYDVATFKLHDEFNFNLRTNDIAILQAKEQFDVHLIDPLKLSAKELKEGDSVILSGFGANQPNGDSSHQMHALQLKVFNQETCRYAMRYSKEVYDEMFCTFTKLGQGTCHGDSGGPLIKDNQLVGVVSWGIPCGAGFPDVHTRITPYSRWIQEEIQSR